MGERRVLIAGCGDLGTRAGLLLHARGYRVRGLRRDPATLPAAIEGVAVDLRDACAVRAAVQGEFTHVLVCTAAGSRDEATYRGVYVEALGHLLAAAGTAPRYWLASSTSVYHQSGGEWLDEDSATEPGGFPGQIQLEAERLLRAHAGERACVVRFGGIYGPGRERLIAEVRAGIGCPREPVQYSNRIHIEDAARLLAFLVERHDAGASLAARYLGVDTNPAPQWEVRHWLAAQLGVTLDDSARERALLRGAGSKRCSSERIRAAGFEFRYPDFRAGYGALLAPPP